MNEFSSVVFGLFDEDGRIYYEVGYIILSALIYHNYFRVLTSDAIL